MKMYAWIAKSMIIIIFLMYSSKGNAQNQDLVKDYLNVSGAIYDSNPDSSFALCCLAEDKLAENSEFAGDVSYCKARYYVLITEYGKASEEINRAILFYEEKESLDDLAGVYSLQSILLKRIGDLEASHRAVLKAYHINVQTGNIPGQIGKLSNLILDFLTPQTLDSALYYLHEIDAVKEHIEGRSLYYYYQNWGTYYYLNGAYQDAITSSNQALVVANMYDMLDSRATITMMLAKSYLANGEIEKAKKFAHQSYNISNQNNLIYEKSEALEQLIAISETLQFYQDAFKYQKELSQIKSEILNIEKVREVNQMEGQLVLAQKEKIIIEQELSIKEEQVAANRIKSQNALLYFIILIVSLLVFFTLWIYVKTRRLNTSINKQKDIIQDKSEAIEEAYNNIHDSLEYSRYIQRAMLPSKDFFQSNFEDYFIYFQPKNIVSGDFYWAMEKDGRVYVAAVDCTGHGVPGAMVSIIGFNGLNRCLSELKLKEPAKILNNLSDFVEESLNNEEKEMKDGMDMSLCSFDLNKGILNYAGANNSIYIISNGVLQEYKSNKRPVGKYPGKSQFTEQKIPLNKGDAVYLFSDGYADQFGGLKGKKMKYKAFREILISCAKEPMEVQMKKVMKKFEDWKGDLEQIDDVCVIGLRI